MGLRYFTMVEMSMFREINLLKEQGLQLRAIKNILQKEQAGEDGTNQPEEGRPLSPEAASAEEKALDYIVGRKQKYIVSLSEEVSREEKANRLQSLLQHMMVETVKNANKELGAEIKESILKELDYQFRMREEREEEHWKREEEHYRKVDEMLRQHYKLKEKPDRAKKEKKKIFFLKH